MTADNVSNEELLNDIELTEEELKAYRKLYEGFYILAHLPENSGFNFNKYMGEYNRYINAANGCNEFLLKLSQIKKERGL